MKNILAELESSIILADGAMGSRIYEKGVGPATCYDHLNLTNPELISEIHNEYIQAGARLIETNTFGANGLKLEMENLGHRVEDINRAGAEIALKAAKDAAYVAGSMGPPPRSGEDEFSDGQIRDAYAEQAQALEKAGVHCLILETFSRLDYLILAIEAARKAVNIPIIAQMVFTKQGRAVSGQDSGECFKAMLRAGADIVGLNCGVGPHGIVETLKNTPGMDAPISAFPNAGFPERSGGRLFYEAGPDYFAETTLQAIQYGARLIGGCCGTGPEHIRAMSERICSLIPPERVEVKKRSTPYPDDDREKQMEPSDFSLNLGRKKMVLVEIDPPKHLDLEHVLTGARALKRAGASAITIAENPLAAPRFSNVILAGMINRETGMDIIVHMTGRDRNLVGTQSTVMGLAASGLNNVLAVTGDPPPAGSDEVVKGVFDLRSFELIKLLDTFNQGTNFHGDDMRVKTNFCIGGAYNPNTKNKGLQIKRMLRKKELGARYFLTQPVYTKEKIDEVAELTREVDASVFLGIMPLASYRNAQFLHNEFPGISIPEDIRERMKAAGKAGLAAGTEIAWELVKYAWPKFDGVYIIPPFNKYPVAVDLIGRIKEMEKEQ